jgi:hypothetical protein
MGRTRETASVGSRPNTSNPAAKAVEAAAAVATEVTKRVNDGAQLVTRTVVGTIFDLAAPLVRDISNELVVRIDLAPLAERIADSVDVNVVAVRVADAVDVDAVAKQVVESVDLDPIIEKLRGELGPIVQEVLEELELGVLAERVLDQLDLPTLITGTLEELRMGSVVRAAIRRPRAGDAASVDFDTRAVELPAVETRGTATE